MHSGYVAGRYRDGSWSDHWTDVKRCAEATFTAYRPACRCGWTGPALTPDAAGHLAALGAWADHTVPAAPELRRCRARPRPLAQPVRASRPSAVGASTAR